jgi:hypothetical protein
MATPYVISSDLVSAYPAKSLEIAQYIDGFKADLALVQNAQTGTTYSFVAADFTKLVTLSNASPVAVTLPDEATASWPAGTTLRLLNQGAGTVTVAGAVGVTINGTPLTLAQYKGAALIKTGTDTWTFAPFSSGVGAADFSDAATDTYTGYKYKTFTTSGTLTVTTAGFADLFIVGGGAGSSSAGGSGGGGVLQVTDAYLPEGSINVTIGAGGAPLGRNGIATNIGSYFAPGGGGTSNLLAFNGGSGGGFGGGSGAGGAGTPGVGFAGGSGSASPAAYGAGGGGGAGAVGGNGSSVAGGNGGNGASTTIAGTTPTSSYVAGSFTAGGGGGGGTNNSGTAGTGGTGGGTAGVLSGNATSAAANTGGGGGGGGQSWSVGTTGGSGLVIVRVAV